MQKQASYPAPTKSLLKKKRAALSCRTLSADESTVKTGLVSKTHRDYLFKCFDKPVQRKLVLKGAYLLRYKVNKNGEAKGEPTGMPVEVVNGTFNVSLDDPTTFEIHSIYQTYAYKCESEEECKSWLQSLNFVKENAIKVRLGHSSVGSSDSLTNQVAAQQIKAAIVEKEAELQAVSIGLGGMGGMTYAAPYTA